MICSLCSRAYVEDIYEDMNEFGLKSSDLKVVSNARLAIDWLEATFPELADQSFEEGSVLVSRAHPYAPIDASLLLQVREFGWWLFANRCQNFH